MEYTVITLSWRDGLVGPTEIVSVRIRVMNTVFEIRISMSLELVRRWNLRRLQPVEVVQLRSRRVIVILMAERLSEGDLRNGLGS
jgi:hypothetical protein